MKIKIFRMNNDAILPQIAHLYDAGMDVFSNHKEDIMLKPFESIVIGTGLKIEIPDEFMLEVKNRSSIASKKNLIVGSCVCDARYSGEIKINLHNIGKEPRIIKFGDKIAQLVLIPIGSCQIEEVESEEQLYSYAIKKNEAYRGSGGFGSSDKK